MYTSRRKPVLRYFVILTFLICLAPVALTPCAMADDEVYIISMNDTLLKYCPPVIASDGSAVINLLAIYLDNPQTVYVEWYLDGYIVYNDFFNVNATPFFDGSFQQGLSPSLLNSFNSVGIHTVGVEVYDLPYYNLLAEDRKIYEIVSCSSGSLTLGTPSSQCLGVIPDNIPATFYGDGSINFTTANWTDELGNTTSTVINVGSFNAIDTLPTTWLQNIYNTPEFHFLRLDAPINSTGDVWVSDTVSFFVQPCTPNITSFDPTSGTTGTSVKIYGSSFTGTTSVTFGGAQATKFTVDSDTEIRAVVGSGASGKIGVTTPGGTATSTKDFTYIQPIGLGTYLLLLL